MQQTIQQYDAKDLTKIDLFIQLIQSETPLLVSGLHYCESDLTDVVWELAHRPTAERKTGHIATSLESISEAIHVPEQLGHLVEQIFAQQDMVTKALPVKLWMQPQGHVSHLHYDGNSLCGINWQVSGEKHWILVSPNTPPPFLPLSQVGCVPEDYIPDPQKIDFIELVTQPGDLLFVPRY